MAKPATTHVLEIETGIGEPSFVPLTLGQEVQPISIGRKGMWRIESPRVLDIHAFVYFDGNALFVQSADETAAATVDGYKIGKAWTELHAPCKIDIGAARLRYRSLQPKPQPAPNDNVTAALPRPPVAPPEAPAPYAGGGPTARMPPMRDPREIPSMPPAAGAPPPQLQRPQDPVSFPKESRPFKPGEFSHGGDDNESTRIAPIDTSAARTGMSAAMPRPFVPGDDPSTRPEGMIVQGQPGAMTGPFPQMGMMQDPGMMQGGPGPMTGPYPAAMSGAYPGAPGPYPHTGTAAYPGLPHGMGPGMPPSMPPGGYGSTTPQQPIPQKIGLERFVAEFKAFSPPKKVLVFLMPIALLCAVFIFFTDDAPPPKPRAHADAGASAEGGAVAAASGAPKTATATKYTLAPNAQVWPPSVSCPPPGWPETEALPCIPPGYAPPAAATATTPPVDTGGTAPPRDVPEAKDAGAPKEPKEPKPAPGQKTLERQAVDLVAAGRFAEAAAIYDQLAALQQQRDPKNTDPTYREAARILRAKLDAGAP